MEAFNMSKCKDFSRRALSIFLFLVMLFGSLGTFPAFAAPVQPANVAGLPLLDTVADRIIYPYSSTIGSTTQGEGFSSSVAWRGSSDAGVGYFQQTGSMAAGSWVRKQFNIARAGNYRVELIYKGGTGRGSSQFYLYPAADFPAGGSVTSAYSVASPLDMNTMSYSANIREASNPSDPTRILQTSTKAVNNYLSYNLGDYVLAAGAYAVENRVTAAGLPVLVAVMLVPYGEPGVAPGLSLNKAEMTLDLTTKPTDTVAATVNTADGWGNLTWKSSDESVVSVTGAPDGTATVAAVGRGAATITATVTKAGDEFTAELHATVGETPAVTLSPSLIMLNTVTRPTAYITADVAAGYSIISWASGNTGVATVPAGTANPVLVTAVADGTSSVTVTVARASDGSTATASVPVVVLTGAESRIDITYSSGQDKVLAVSPVKTTVTVAGGATAGELTGALAKTAGADISVEVIGKAATAALVDGDMLKVTRGGEVCLYSVVVMGDKSSTEIAAKKLEGFDIEFHGSNIGRIDSDSSEITLVDGFARYFTIDESVALGKDNGKRANRNDYTTTGQGGVPGEVAGRHRSLRSSSAIVTQLESSNGTAQTYKITNPAGTEKTTALPGTGDKLIVVSEDGGSTRAYDIKVETAALSGRLDVVRGPSTAGTAKELVLAYHAGQRTPEAEVTINLPPGVDATLDNTYVNLIGRGEIVLSKFHLSRGKETGSVFERPEMHKLLGRFAVNYAYQTLGAVAITGQAATGKTITFSGLDLRPNNGADLVLRIEGVKFDIAGAYNFSASLKTKAGAITSSNPAYVSFGKGSEEAELNVVHQVTSLERVIYNENNFAVRDADHTKNSNVLLDLEYKAGVRAGDYTSFEMAWQAPAGAVSLALEHATGTIGAGGSIMFNDDWAPVAGVTLAAGATSLRLTGIAPNTYHRYRLKVEGGSNPGYSNEIGFYSGMLNARSFGLVETSAGSTVPRATSLANTAAVNKAIAWLNSIGGGTLFFPNTSTASMSYRLGTVYLKSNVFLYLDSNAYLEAAAGASTGIMDDPESGWWCYRDYGSGTNSSEDPYANPDNFLSKQDDGHCFYQNTMFYARREENMKIIGNGRIRGTGISTGDGTVHGQVSGNRADDLIALKLCKNFELGGIPNGLNLTFDVPTKDGGVVYLYHNQTPSGALVNSYPVWADNDGKIVSTNLDNMLEIDSGGHFATLFGACDHMNVHDVYYGKNNRAGRDVFDFMENNDVHVTNIMASGVSDDIVAPKSDCAMGFTRPVSGYWVRNVVGDTNCNNFQIGSETADDIQNLYIDNLIVLGSNKCGFSISTNDGGYMKNINLNGGQTGPVLLPAGGHFSRSRTPIFISISHRGRVIGAENNRVRPDGTLVAGSGSSSTGLERVITNVPIGRIEGLTLTDVDITEVYSGTAYSSGYYPYTTDKSFFTSVVVGYEMPPGTGLTRRSHTVESTAGYASDYVGMPDGRTTGYIKDVTFNNVDILMKGGGPASRRGNICNELNVGQYNSPDMGERPSYGLYVTHAENFVYNGGKLGFERNDDLYALMLNDVIGAQINNLTMDKGTGNGVVTGNNADGLIKVRNSRNINISGAKSADGPTPVFRKAQPISGNANAAQIVRDDDNRPLIALPNTVGFGETNAVLIYPRDAVEPFEPDPESALSLYINERGAIVAQYVNPGMTGLARLFIAAYGANGVLLAMTSTEARSMPVSGVMSALTEVLPNAAEYKAFVWDEDYVPMVDGVSKTRVASSGVVLSRTALSLRKGEEHILMANVTPANSLYGKVKWTTDNARVALVGSDGKVLATGVGTARISAYTNDGRSAVCTVTVTAANVGAAAVVISRESLSLALGEPGLLGAYVTPVYADNTGIIWSSSDEGVAEVSPAGFITAKAIGSATITATSAGSGVSASCEVFVTNSLIPTNLHIPREAVAYDACTLLWDKPSNLYTTGLKEYVVYMDGVQVATTTKMGYSASGLRPDTEYVFRVDAKRIDDTIETGPKVSVRTKPAPTKIINVTDAAYGAVGDGGWSGATRIVNPDLNGVVLPDYRERVTAASNTGTPVNNPANRTTGTLNTGAIQKAINDCPPGGEVYIPEGTFLSGPLFLKSNMTLRIDGELIATTDVNRYPKITSMFEGWEIPQTFASLLTIGELDTFGDYNIHDVYLCGKGRIDASGLALDFVQTSASTTVGEQTAIRKRGRAVVLHNAQDVYFRDLDIGFGPSWTLHAILSDHITFDNMIIQGKVKGTDNGAGAGSASRVRNGDGIGADSSTNMNIFNSVFHCGDDSITIKCGKNESGWRRNKPVMNIRVTNNILPQSQGGIVIGSEMSGGVRNVWVQDNRIIQDGWEAFDIKSDIGRGGMVSNIVVKDLNIAGARIGARISFKYATNNDGDRAPVSPEVDGVLLENFYGNVNTAFEIVGINGATTGLSPNNPARESKIRNVMIVNCNLISGTKSYTGVQGNVTCHAVLQDCDGVTVDNVTIRSTGSGNPIVARPWGVLDSANIRLDSSLIINAPDVKNTAIRVRTGQTAVRSLSGTTLTVDAAATAASVKAGVISTDGSIQSYAYTDSGGAPKADAAAVAAGDRLVVTSQDGTATAVYTIAVQIVIGEPIVFPIITSTPYVKSTLGTISSASDSGALGGSYQQFNSTGYAVGAWVEYTFGAAPGTSARPAIPAGTYDVVFRYRVNGTTARGFVQMAVDGANLGVPINQLLKEDGTSSAGVAYPEIKMGTMHLSGGDHVFRFTVTTGGSNNVNFDGIILRPVSP